MSEIKHKLRMSLLLVEDDDIDRSALKRAIKLKKIDCDIVDARDGVEALDILRGKGVHPPPRPPYVVLLDINMPRMNGLEFLQELRSESMSQPIRDSIVFILTTSAAEQDRASAYAHHVSGYMVKPDYMGGLSKIVELLVMYDQIVEFP